MVVTVWSSIEDDKAKCLVESGCAAIRIYIALESAKKLCFLACRLDFSLDGAFKWVTLLAQPLLILLS
jgi:hypothetical protein